MPWLSALLAIVGVLAILGGIASGGPDVVGGIVFGGAGGCRGYRMAEQERQAVMNAEPFYGDAKAWDVIYRHFTPGATASGADT